MKSLPLSGAICAASLLVLAPVAAAAHVVFERPEAAAGASYRAVLRIGHGCDGAATTTVRVQIPEGVIGARPMPKAGWTLTTTKGPYAREYKQHHGVVGAGVKEIVWSGGLLPDDHYDEFTFSAFVADAVVPGSTVYFPVAQECERGAHAWTEIPAAGDDARKLKAPAPALRIVAASDAAPPVAAPATVFRTGQLTIEAPWTRATPAGAAVAGGFAKISNAGATPDRLIGATLPLAGRVELHEMAVTDGVMRMRALDKGLEIPAGGAVELKPGGFHLMFLDLKGRLVEGQPQQGTLIFETAGAVPVIFGVSGIGAPAPAQSHKH